MDCAITGSIITRARELFRIIFRYFFALAAARKIKIYDFAHINSRTCYIISSKTVQDTRKVFSLYFETSYFIDLTCIP